MKLEGYTKIFNKLVRGILAFLVFIFALFMFGYSFVTERNGEEIIAKAIRDNIIAVASLLIFSSIYSAFAKYDGIAYDEFLKIKDKKFKLAEDALAVVRSLEFIVDCVILTVMSFLLPIPAAFPVLIVLDFIVRMIARKGWYSGAPYEKSATLPLLRDLAIWIIGYCFLAYIGPSYVGVFGVVGWLAVEHVYFTLAVIFVPAVIYFVISYGVAFSKRAKFIKQLRHICKVNGYKLSKINRPYFSIINITDTEDFSVEANGRTYVCKLLSGKRRAIPMIFSDDGTASYEHGLGFGKAKLVNYYKYFRYELPCSGIKCVIITHHPRKLFREVKGSTRPLHLGDNFEGYNILHPDAFLRGVENNTLI